MLRLMDECRRHPSASLLMRTEGRYAGSYAFPFCHIAVLSHINRSQIEREAPELSRLFPPSTTITRDELATWTLEPQALLARLMLVILHSGNSAYVEELHAALGMTPS
jgi:hypothetical protein